MKISNRQTFKFSLRKYLLLYFHKYIAKLAEKIQNFLWIRETKMYKTVHIIGACRYFDRRHVLVKMIKALRDNNACKGKFDDFDVSLHKITIFQLVLLTYSVYTDANHTHINYFFCLI